MDRNGCQLPDKRHSRVLPRQTTAAAAVAAAAAVVARRVAINTERLKRFFFLPPPLFRISPLCLATMFMFIKRSNKENFLIKKKEPFDGSCSRIPPVADDAFTNYVYLSTMCLLTLS